MSVSNNFRVGAASLALVTTGCGIAEGDSVAPATGQSRVTIEACELNNQPHPDSLKGLEISTPADVIDLTTCLAGRVDSPEADKLMERLINLRPANLVYEEATGMYHVRQQEGVELFDNEVLLALVSAEHRKASDTTISELSNPDSGMVGAITADQSDRPAIILASSATASPLVMAMELSHLLEHADNGYQHNVDPANCKEQEMGVARLIAQLLAAADYRYEKWLLENAPMVSLTLKNGQLIDTRGSKGLKKGYPDTMSTFLATSKNQAAINSIMSISLNVVATDAYPNEQDAMLEAIVQPHCAGANS
jgi:hypothetical protein